MVASSNKKTTAKKSTAKKSTTAKKNTAAKHTPVKHENDGMIRKEIILLVAITCNVILFLSNLHMCGEIGETLHSVMVGMFGILGYAFPVYLLLCAIMYVMHRGEFRTYLKLVVSFLLLIFICGLVQLVVLEAYDPALTLMDYYKAALTQMNGGLFGGMMLNLLYASLGMVGSYVVLMVLTAIGLVFITERSILDPIKNGGQKVYTTARETNERRKVIRQERAEEANRLRSSQKVSGVAVDTRVGKKNTATESTAAEEAVAPVKARRTPVAPERPVEVLKGQIHGIDSGYRTTTAERARAEQQIEKEVEVPTEEAAVTKKKPSLLDIPIHKSVSSTEVVAEPAVEEEEEVLTVGKDYRTLSELESLDELHSSFRKEPERVEEKETPLRWNFREDRFEEIPIVKQEEETPILVNRNTDEYEKEDYRTVMTGNGKLIEADIDPKEDPLTVKRMQNRERQEQQQKLPEEPKQASIWSSGSERTSSGGHSFTQAITPKADQARETAARVGERPVAQPTQPTMTPQPKKKKLKPYEKPPIKLMSLPAKRSKGTSDEELRETAAQLQETLQTFGVGVTVNNISCGPTVTRYELKPEMGVKVSKIVALADDIKLSLAAADIRIEAPIPGKAAVGIEVPNKENNTVYLREVIESPEFAKHPSKLAFALGRDIGGQCVVADLAKMPHLLIAGATGSGKSVCINTLIVSILYKALPSEVELIMIDPKVVELSVYNGIPHLKIPVVTDAKKAAAALNWAVQEMNSRYKKFADYNVRDLKGYNEKIKREWEAGETEEKPLPQIVIIVDELADLMMVAPNEVEDAICRLAQMARAAGLHLVLATQRPSVNVITGLIKADVPSRIAFSVSSGVDSRTIIDMNGAEKLLGKGDMLYYPSGYQKPVRVQGAFVADSEVSSIVEFLSERDRDNTDGSERDSALELAMLSGEEENGMPTGGGGSSERDAYFREAGRFIIEKDKASIGMLQRNFKIGFNRAARIVDQLEAAGVVGPEEGTKARKVLMTITEFEELLRS